MAYPITTISFLDVLDSTLTPPKPYIDFRSKYVAYVFKSPANVTVLSINGYNVTSTNFPLLPSNAIIPDPNDNTKCLLNWSKLNTIWTIPIGVVPYIAKFTYNSSVYYVIFGIITSDGGFDTTIGCGKEILITIDPGDTTPIVFNDVHLESYPFKQPCAIVSTYYNTTGIISISLV